MVYLNNNSIIGITKARPIADLVYKNRLNKRDTEIDEKIDISIINELFIDYAIKLFIDKKYTMYTVPLKPTIINIRNEMNKNND